MGMFDLPVQQPQQFFGPSAMDQARLTPQQGAAFLSAQGGQQLGAAGAGMFRQAMGMPNERERMDAAKAEIARRTQGMTDQVEVLKVAMQVLSQAGFPEQAMAVGKQLEDLQNKRRDDERAQKKDDATAEVARRKVAVLERGSPEQQLIERYAQELAKLDKLTPTTPEHERQLVLVREIGNRLARQNIQVKDAGGFLQVFVEGQPAGTVEKTVDPTAKYKADSIVDAALAREAAKASNDPTKKEPVKGMVDGQGRQIYQDKQSGLFILGANGWESAEKPGGIKKDDRDSALPIPVRNKLATSEATIRTMTRLLTMLDDKSVRAKLGPAAYANRLADVYDRFDAAGVPIRSELTNLMSSFLHARSGAAVTVQEFDRLRGFLPQPTDSAEVVIRKLQSMIRVAADETNALRKVNGGAEVDYPIPTAGGIQSPPVNPQRAAPAAQSTAVARPANKAAYDALPSGTLYVHPKDGKTYRKP